MNSLKGIAALMTILCFISISILLLLFTEVKSKIDQYSRRFLRKHYWKDNGLRIRYFGSKRVNNRSDFLLMGLGQDQQQHHALYIGGVSRARVSGSVAVGIIDM